MSFTVTINGTDRTESVTFGSLVKEDRLNAQVDNLTFTVEKYGDHTFVPTLGHEIIIERDSVTLFGGVIMRITEFIDGNGVLVYRVECNDFSQYLKRQLVTERYENMTAEDIIDALVTDYTTDGFTIVNVDASVLVRSISFNRITVLDAIQKLAKAIGYVWYVDYSKDIHFFAKNTELAPFNLTDTSENYIYDTLEIEEDLSQVRNGVLLQGGDETSTSTRTEYETGDGTRVQFPLKNKFASLPTVTVGGVGQTVGVEYEDNDASFDVMWNYNEKYLRFTAGHTPGAGTNNIVTTGYYEYPIVVYVPAPASQTLYGLYEYAITDKSIASQAEAIARIQAELQSFQNEYHEGSFSTLEHGLRSGQVITINSDLREKSLSVLIQSVSMMMIDPLGEHLEYRVSFATLTSLGIIEYLQEQLRSKEVIIDDQETLLNFFPLSDSLGTSDSVGGSSTTGPYVWGTMKWGYFTWS